MARAKAKPARSRTPQRRGRINTTAKATPAQVAITDEIAGRAKVALDRKQENRERFNRVIYGTTRPDGRVIHGRLARLQQAFQYLIKSTNRDHYEFSQQQATALLNAVEIEVHKLRQFLQANAKS